MALLLAGQSVPASQLKHRVVEEMRSDEIILTRTIGKSRKVFFISNREKFRHYLKNQHGIADLNTYIELLENNGLRADAVQASSDSKTKSTRTFKGFPINTYSTIEAEINNQKFSIQSVDGCFTFISDFESFRIPEEVTVVGVENAENFRYLKEQAYLFSSIKPLFVCRYPQSNDLVRWLQQIPSPYLHFGDFDFGGIAIFANEFRKYLPERSSFFIPENIEYLLDEYGNRDLYGKQLYFQETGSNDQAISKLIDLFHKYKKCLEQEVLIRK